MMRKLTMLRAAIFGLAVVAVAVPGLSTTAEAQMSALLQTPAPSSAESAAVADGSVPGWYRRVGEGPFSMRDPASGLYLLLGGHVGFANSTRLDDDHGCDNPNAFFIGCDNARPSDSLGTGGGGSIGIGTRLTPAVRLAAIATGEGGYRFRNDRPWVDESSGETFVEDFSIHSYQFTANAYLDVAGLLPPGVLGGFNPYVMGGVGVAYNVTGEIRESNTLGSGNTTSTVVHRYPGGTEPSFLWTAGGGVQYRIAPGVVADVFYQFVDAGRFRAATGKKQIEGQSGLPFDPPFEPIRGNLETHRLGFAVNLEFEAIARWFRR